MRGLSTRCSESLSFMAPRRLWLWPCLYLPSAAFREKSELRAWLLRFQAAGELERLQIQEELGEVRHWNVSAVTDMSGLFAGMSFNEPLDGWDTSKVTDMSYMFRGAQLFDQASSIGGRRWCRVCNCKAARAC